MGPSFRTIKYLLLTRYSKKRQIACCGFAISILLARLAFLAMASLVRTIRFFPQKSPFFGAPVRSLRSGFASLALFASFLPSALVVLFFLLVGCSGLERSEREKLRRQNSKREPICRTSDSYLFAISPPSHTPRPPYPWESEINLPRITKEFFRCKGNSSNPPILDDENKPCLDCEGKRHGLPVLHGKENVYPILVDLLNFLQKRTGKRIVITCGHRCPTHNTYSDPRKEIRTSKHQIGAEVDFYVQGMEDRPLEIIGLLMQYYQEQPRYANQKEYLEFQRYDKPDSFVAIQPWYNKEIYIKLYQKEEGRDIDNRHPHPYISIQVRYDLGRKERVLYSWEKAHKGYPRTQ